MELAVKAGFDVRVVALPPGVDPADEPKGFEAKLEGYIGQCLELVDEHPDAMAFLSDSARTLWPKSGVTVRRQTMIDLARSVMAAAPGRRRGQSGVNTDIAAASL